MTRQVYLLCGLLSVIATVCGCSSRASGPPVYPVTGTVVYQSKPVGGAVVAFRAENAPGPATGITDAAGRFKLTTFNSGDGAVAGKHKVTVTKAVVEGAAVPQEQTMEDAVLHPAGPVKQQNQLPEKYGDPAKPLLEATVSESGTNDFTLKLD